MCIIYILNILYIHIFIWTCIYQYLSARDPIYTYTCTSIHIHMYVTSYSATRRRDVLSPIIKTSLSSSRTSFVCKLTQWPRPCASSC